MTRTAAPALAVLVVLSAVLALPTALAASGSGTMVEAETVRSNHSSTLSDQPGTRLGGIIGVQAAEVRGEIEERSFRIALGATDSNASKAAVVAGQYGALEERLAALRDRAATLRERRANGSISEGRFRAEMAAVAARTTTMVRLAEQTANATRGLPGAVLEAKGVNVTAIETLRQQAANLSGPEVAEIARSIAGNAVGERLGANGTAGPPADVPGMNATNRTRGASGSIDDAADNDSSAGGPPEDNPGRYDRGANTTSNWLANPIDSIATIITG